jgi:hypothetical protein
MGTNESGMSILPRVSKYSEDSMSIHIETTCIRCERIHKPSRDDFRHGVWRICPRCRDGPESKGIRSHDDPEQRPQGANKRPEMSINLQEEYSAA